MTVLPANAGMIPTAHLGSLAPGRAPRQRGDDPPIDATRSSMLGCSPPTRG